MGFEKSGFFVIDKPAGLTSAKVVARIKKRLKARKVGHAGTLDPFATGILICCINRATRLARFFLHGHKKYEAVLYLGIETATQDVTGPIIATGNAQGVTIEQIKAVLQRFTGRIDQVPPTYSALKHQGVPMYKLARQGVSIRKPARPVLIKQLRLLEVNLPEISFELTCSGGTYIRTLGADIGRALGCGGHLKSLRRTASSGLTIQSALALPLFEDLAASGTIDAHMVSMADALSNMPSHAADDHLIAKLRYGRNITQQDVDVVGNAQSAGNMTGNMNGWVKILDIEHHLLAVLNYNHTQQRYDYCCSFINESFTG